MIVVADSSVLIDWLRDTSTPQVEALDALRSRQRLWIGDLMLVEVLQGTRDERHASRVERLLLTMPIFEIGGQDIAIAAARNYRVLRALGKTPRKTIDTLIATRCIIDGLPLLFSDRDFQPFVDHLGLRDVMIR